MQGPGCAGQWFCTADPLGERRYVNWITHIHTQGLTSNQHPGQTELGPQFKGQEEQGIKGVK